MTLETDIELELIDGAGHADGVAAVSGVVVENTSILTQYSQVSSSHNTSVYLEITSNYKAFQPSIIADTHFTTRYYSAELGRFAWCLKQNY